MRRGFLGGGKDADTSTDALGRVGILRKQLRDAERELRQCREERLRAADPIPVASGDPPDTAVAKEAGAPVGQLGGSSLHELAPTDLEALANMEEPASEAIHRLAEALMLLLEARVLVDLGDHPLPGRVRWANLQALLRKRSVWTDDAGSIAAVLAQKPFGSRLRDYVRERLDQNGKTVTREAIELAGGTSCVAIFDFVRALLCDGADVVSIPAIEAADAKQTLTQEDRQRRATAAVAEAEHKVAQLRRKLREVEKSEAAAAAFAAEHTPTSQAPPLEIAENKITDDSHNGAPPSEAAMRMRGESHNALSLQYRLNEVEVPPMQDTILHCLLRTVLEPRKSSGRVLEIIGRSEDREEPEIAYQRAEAVRTWLLENDASACSDATYEMRVEAISGGSRTCRCVELKVLDIDGAEVRRRAETIMSRFMPELTGSTSIPQPDGELGRIKASSQAVPRDTSNRDDATGLETCDEKKNVPLATFAPAEVLDRPEVLVEEFDTPQRGLKVVFAACGLAANNTELDVGSQTVRLASIVGAWPPVEVSLPFACEPAPSAARFSRKAGTLTVRLFATADCLNEGGNG